MVAGRKNQIIAEARRLFGSNGYDSVTIRQLADACGITEPALYRHFPSKEAIYDAVLDSLKSYLNHQTVFNRLKDEPEIRVILFELASHILVFFNSHRDLYRLLLYSTLRQHSKGRQVFRAIRTPYVVFLTDQLDRLLAAGKIRRKNNEITAQSFIGMVFDCAAGASVWKGFQGKTFKPADIIANNVPIFVEGLSNDPEAAR